MNKALYQRYLEGSRLYYDVLCSKGTYYYTVEMLGQVAISCECIGNATFKKHCEHMKTAEKAERAFQNSAEIPNVNVVKEKEVLPPLNGNREFSLLR